MSATFSYIYNEQSGEDIRGNLNSWRDHIIENATNIAGAIIIRKGDASLNEYMDYSGAEVHILSNVIDLETTASVTIALPTGVKMFVNEVGLIVTDANTVTVQPTVNFGTLFPTTLLTGLTAAGDRYKIVVASGGQTQLLLEVTTPATATTLTARAYWKGFIVEKVGLVTVLAPAARNQSIKPS